MEDDLKYFLCSIMLNSNQSKESKMIKIRNFMENFYGPLCSIQIYNIIKDYQKLDCNNNFDLMKDYCVKRLPDNLINLIPFICYLISLEEDINREIENINSKIIKHDHCYN